MATFFATQNLNAVLRLMQWGVIALIFLFFLFIIERGMMSIAHALG